MLDEFAEKITKAQTKKPLAFIAVFIIISLMLAPGITRLVGNVEPSLEKVLPQDIIEIKTMNNMRTMFSADMTYIIIHAEHPVDDVRDPKLLKYLDAVEQKLRTRDYIFEVTSIADLIKEQNNNVIPESIYETKKLLRQNPMTPLFTDHSYSFAVVSIRTDTGASAKAINSVISSIEEDLKSLEGMNPGSRAEITGFNAIDKATFEVIMSDFAYITMIAMALVAVVVFITFKSFVKGMLPMAVVMISLIWTMGIIGYLGLTITVVTMVAAAMIMGLGIDFGIHVVHNYYSFRKKHSAAYSITETMKELLRAMLGASLTTIAGFLALLFGMLPAMKILGIVLAIGILTTLIGAVFLLPAIVYLYDTKKRPGKRLATKS